MKLISHVTLRLSIAITVIMSAWAVLFYLAMIDEINDETDDSLEDYSEAIIIRALAGEKLPSKNNGSNNQYYMTKVDDQYAQTHPSIEYSDEMVYIEEKRETEPARILKTIFQNDRDEHFLLVVMTPTIEKRDLKHSIFIWMSILYATLLIIIIVLNICVFYYSMKPLYRLLGWLRDYHVGQRNKPLDNKNSITEFRTLYDATNLFAARNEKLFEQQKRFIGNASHELQTPLAICRNRLEMMMEDESVSERQLEELAKLDLHSIEQPIRAGQPEAMAALTATSPLPIAFDEELIGVNTDKGKAELLDCLHPQYIVLKPSLHGGMAGCRKWIDLAEERGIGWWVTSALESNIGLNAIAQWCATLHPAMPQGLGTGLLFTDNIPMPLEIRKDCLWYVE